jgi:energy-coupling factor transport system ATP-binding protein
LILLNNVSFQYKNGTSDAGLFDINLHIKKGEVVLLCGESGCGKTTLTRLINGLIPHYFEGNLSGEIIIDNKKAQEMPLYELSKYVGSVFQNPRSQFFCVDTNSELAFGCENQGLSVNNINKRIDLAISHLHIQDLMERRIFELSGGEKQKIACGCVHTASPDIIVLDEPSSNLDSASTKALASIISHWKNEGKTIVIAEHKLYYLGDIADRLLYMQKGKIEKELSMAQAKRLGLSVVSGMGLRPLSLEKLKAEHKKDGKNEGNILLSDFHYCYKPGIRAINIDSLSVPERKIIAVVGKNGSGKTTFARCLCGLNKRFNGKVKIKNEVYSKRHCLGRAYMVMQDVNHQLFTSSLLDEVLLSMEDDNKEKAEAILERLNLLNLKDLHPMSLSGGQKQRTAIASAVASERDIIIFDEPTSGLDLRSMEQVSGCLKMLKEMGKTLLVISHDLELIIKTCDYAVHLEGGKIKDSYCLDNSGYGKLTDFFMNQ